MRSVIKFAKDNGYEYSTQENIRGLKEVFVSTESKTFKVSERFNTSAMGISGRQGSNHKYDIKIMKQTLLSIKFNTQKELVEFMEINK